MLKTVDDYIKANLTHSIHTSERMSFRGCRRRWNWIFRDRYYPKVTPKPLEFGIAYHKAMESWYEPTMWDKDPNLRLTLALETFRQVIRQQKLDYTRLNGEPDPELLKDYDERVELGEGMIRYHCTVVSPKLDKGFKPVKVELSFEVPITDPDGNILWCKCDNCRQLFKRWFVKNEPHWDDIKDFKGLPVTYGGRIDMLAEDELGRYWVFDWKTAARLTGGEEQQPDDFIYVEDQITSYLWALWVLKLPVAGFVYHETKKAFPVEPEPNKVMRLGRMYSVSKSMNTSYELYKRTVEENDSAAYTNGLYDEFLNWLQREGPKFYSRKVVGRNDTELFNAGRNICLEALEMTNPDLAIYPSPGRFGCTFCLFRQPCMGVNAGEDFVYTLESLFEKRAHRYWETAEASTDSKGGQ